MGLKIAKHLEKKYNQPYLHIPVIPIGEEATTAFLRKVVEFAKIDSAPSERFISQEAHRYYYYLEHFSNFFSEYHFNLPTSFATVGDAAYNLAVTTFLADQIGLVPVKQIITDNTPKEYREQILELYHHLSEEVCTDVEFIEDGFIVEEEIENTDFGTGTPLILGSSWEQDVAEKIGGILVEIGTVATEEVVLNRSYIGYNGALSLLEKIYSASIGGK
jgi:nitrogenase molybdenum-iron protein beta chain